MQRIGQKELNQFHQEKRKINEKFEPKLKKNEQERNNLMNEYKGEIKALEEKYSSFAEKRKNLLKYCQMKEKTIKSHIKNAEQEILDKQKEIEGKWKELNAFIKFHKLIEGEEINFFEINELAEKNFKGNKAEEESDKNGMDLDIFEEKKEGKDDAN